MVSQPLSQMLALTTFTFRPSVTRNLDEMQLEQATISNFEKSSIITSRPGKPAMHLAKQLRS